MPEATVHNSVQDFVENRDKGIATIITDLDILVSAR
jgi:hypothetical protein